MQVTLFKRSCKTVVSTALASRDPSIEAIKMLLSTLRVYLPNLTALSGSLRSCSTMS
ncbi:hypothetical protein DSO57_1014814 [Entomophthora muscae]|uniref:Uncharacterized protein n=1 Tax=Entomophthora muscae TaxID=34485 RepID=A0ACC2RJW1_9FUNG|nr:hypothetical protein DSO57_1014814 [Entomophthora muscae]